MGRKYISVYCPKCGESCRIKWEPNREFMEYHDGAPKRVYREVFICRCYRCEYGFMSDLSGKEIERV